MIDAVRNADELEHEQMLDPVDRNPTEVNTAKGEEQFRVTSVCKNQHEKRGQFKPFDSVCK